MKKDIKDLPNNFINHPYIKSQYDLAVFINSSQLEINQACIDVVHHAFNYISNPDISDAGIFFLDWLEEKYPKTHIDIIVEMHNINHYSDFKKNDHKTILKEFYQDHLNLFIRSFIEDLFEEKT